MSRFMLVDGRNTLLHPVSEGRYSVDIGLGRFTGLVTTGPIFAMRLDAASDRHVKIHKIVLYTGFSGTTAASAQIVQVKRFSTAACAGGTALTVPTDLIKNDSSWMRDSDINDARYADITGISPLTSVGVVFETSLGSVSFPRSSGGGIVPLELNWDTPDELHLIAGQGIALVTLNTAVAGDLITGFIEWSEVVEQ